MKSHLISLISDLQNLEAPENIVHDGAKHLLEVAAIVDRYIFELGRKLRHEAGCAIDMDAFTHILRDAVEGNATWMFEKAEEARTPEPGEFADTQIYSTHHWENSLR